MSDYALGVRSRRALNTPDALHSSTNRSNLNLVRAAELKHCRVAMLATVGWAWTATGTHFEGMLSTSKGISFADAVAAGPLLGAAKVTTHAGWRSDEPQ